METVKKYTELQEHGTFILEFQQHHWTHFRVVGMFGNKLILCSNFTDIEQATAYYLCIELYMRDTRGMTVEEAPRIPSKWDLRCWAAYVFVFPFVEGS